MFSFIVDYKSADVTLTNFIRDESKRKEFYGLLTALIPFLKIVISEKESTTLKEEDEVRNGQLICDLKQWKDLLNSALLFQPAELKEDDVGLVEAKTQVVSPSGKEMKAAGSATSTESLTRASVNSGNFNPESKATKEKIDWVNSKTMSSMMTGSMKTLISLLQSDPIRSINSIVSSRSLTNIDERDEIKEEKESKGSLPFLFCKLPTVDIRRGYIDINAEIRPEDKFNSFKKSKVGVNLSIYLLDHYYAYILNSCLAAESPIIEQDFLGSDNDSGIYPQDMVAFLPDKNSLILSRHDRYTPCIPLLMKHLESLNLGYDLQVRLLPFRNGYTHAYNRKFGSFEFEGGNCCYCPDKKVFLFAALANWSDNERLIRKMRRFLKKQDIELIVLHVSSIDVSETLSLEEKEKYNRNYYYHLDCHLHYLPNGKILLLNKEIYEEESYIKLKNIFGEDNILDLEYKDYHKANYMFNVILLNTRPKMTLVCPTSPEIIKIKLREFGFKIISPASLNCNSSEYNPDLTRKVATRLRRLGFFSVTERNLTEILPQNVYGYFDQRGNRYSPEIYHQLKTNQISVIGPPLSFNRAHGRPGTGGPHCSTLSLSPSAR